MANTVNDRMRADWNQRAREDANYYVAFGRRDQTEEEFQATAKEMATSFADELARLPAGNPRARRALEIGCGPGRLMRPLAPYFGEIHGVDVSDEMASLARERLADIPHAHPRSTTGSDLAAYADDSFDFVYSYAVFQHIPSPDVVLGYMRETRRVLKEGGIARFQINGLPETAAQYNTWHGVRLSAAAIADFAKENDFQLLALEGIATQYMWTTWRKRPAGWRQARAELGEGSPASIRRVTNAFSGEPAAPTRGRFSSISLWVLNLPEESDLNDMRVMIGGLDGFVSYIGPPEDDGLRQVNAYLPAGLASGLQTVEIQWLGQRLCPPATLRLMPPGPPVPRIAKVSDGVDLLSGKKIVSGTVKVVLEETERLDELEVKVGGHRVNQVETFCTDPRLPKHEVNFRVPETVTSGTQRLDLRLGKKAFPPVYIEVYAQI
ncbi:MAG: methyltransferase domain-containing protein [bacterium]|nr:methyltransferase domain-containing protein [bacterium]